MKLSVLQFVMCSGYGANFKLNLILNSAIFQDGESKGANFKLNRNLKPPLFTI